MISLKMKNRKKLLLLVNFERSVGKKDFFKKKKILKSMVFDSVKFHGTNKFPASKYSVIGNYSTQKAAPVLDDRIQQNLV